MSETKTYFLSKYALTGGIKEVQVGVPSSLQQTIKPVGYYMHYIIGRDIHLTREAAIKKALDMRTKKIAALKRQISKLEKMTFEKEGNTR